MSQLTLSFEPMLSERYATLREYVMQRSMVHRKPMKVIAADMDLSPSALTRKLSPGDGDTARLSVDDLESWLVSTGDVMSVVEYLLAKYAPGAEDERRSRAQSRLTELLEGLPDLLVAAGVRAPGRQARSSGRGRS